MLDLRAALKEAFGFDDFRPYQEEVIRRVMDGRDTLAVLPTGAGKSLTYQLPSLLLPKPTLVISPLIALMKDQLDNLPPALRERATVINSSLDQEELEDRLMGMEECRYRLIYAAPERLRLRSFIQRLGRMGLSLVVVDEAHCVSVWGHDFRPDYLFIRRALDMLSEEGEPPQMMAVTATATPEMQREIAEQLGRPFEVVAAPLYRPNLRMEAIPCANATEKLRRLLQVCHETPGATIVYVNSRERCEQIASFLRTEGIPAAHYHAGLDRETRRATQERFMLGKVRVMAATVAFGMGVDKSNIRLVVHYAPPSSLESYVQEAGRAGRDGRPSRCVMLHSPTDRSNLARWMRQEAVDVATVRGVYRGLQARLGREHGAVPPESFTAEVFGGEANGGDDVRMRVAISILERCRLVARHPDIGRDMHIQMLPAWKGAREEIDSLLEARRAHAESRLAQVLAYASASECRQAILTRHFGQAMEPCGSACDVCMGTAVVEADAKPEPPTAEEVPDVGRVILLAAQSVPFPLGRTGLTKVLTGAPDSVVKRDRCPQYGALEGMARNAVMRMVAQMAEMGLLETVEHNDFPVLEITPLGVDAVQNAPMILANPHTNKPTPARRSRTSAVAAPVEMSEDDDDRFEKLRAWRRIEAQNRGVPPYVVFPDATLRAIACANPQSLAELEPISGIGPSKLENFGDAVLDVLRAE